MLNIGTLITEKNGTVQTFTKGDFKTPPAMFPGLQAEQG